MRTLRSLVGEVIVVSIPALGDDMMLVRLISVESHGIWVESQVFTEKMFRRFACTVSSTTLVLFFPYQKIEFVVSSEGKMCFSERALGL